MLLEISQSLELVYNLLVRLSVFELGQLFFENVLHKLLRRGIPGRIGTTFYSLVELIAEFNWLRNGSSSPQVALRN